MSKLRWHQDWRVLLKAQLFTTCGGGVYHLMEHSTVWRIISYGVCGRNTLRSCCHYKSFLELALNCGQSLFVFFRWHRKMILRLWWRPIHFSNVTSLYICSFTWLLVFWNLISHSLWFFSDNFRLLSCVWYSKMYFLHYISILNLKNTTAPWNNFSKLVHKGILYIKKGNQDKSLDIHRADHRTEHTHFLFILWLRCCFGCRRRAHVCQWAY